MPIVSAIAVQLKNETQHKIGAILPLDITVDGEVSGIEFRIANPGGRRYNLCAQIQSNTASIMRKLDPEESAHLTERMSDLRVAYCLNWGRFTLTAIYHSGASQQKCNSEIISNTVEFVIPPPK
ncbi:MAG: hypothetical protein WB784_00405 [Rhodanobacteraceae bacterium]